jgi:uncharacterized protein YigE (DUF2233 family)
MRHSFHGVAHTRRAHPCIERARVRRHAAHLMSESTPVPVGRLAALAAVVVAVLAIANAARAPHWRTLAPGIEFATMRGEPYCKSGPSTIALLRVDPAQVRLRMMHFLREPDHRPLAIDEWRRRSGATAVFNAGQFYPDLAYMGLFVSDGAMVSPKRHAGFRAALVAEPVGGDSARRPRARVLDLAHDSLDSDHPAWREVAQSFMLFDRDGETRVRQTDQVAGRTAVGEDGRGRIVVATSEGGYTLWDYARLLRRRDLELKQVMNMDGGHEAQMLIDSGGFRYTSFARDPSAGAPVPLPAVIAVLPR